MAATIGITIPLDLCRRGQDFQHGFSLDGPSWTDFIDIHEEARRDSLRSTPLAPPTPLALDSQSPVAAAAAASASPGVHCWLHQPCTLVSILVQLMSLFRWWAE